MREGGGEKKRRREAVEGWRCIAINPHLLYCACM
jgi:hypothetical protein